MGVYVCLCLDQYFQHPFPKHVHTHVHMHSYSAHTHTDTHMHARAHTHAPTHTHTYTHIPHTHMHARMHTCTHTHLKIWNNSVLYRTSYSYKLHYPNVLIKNNKIVYELWHNLSSYGHNTV